MSLSEVLKSTATWYEDQSFIASVESFGKLGFKRKKVGSLALKEMRKDFGNNDPLTILQWPKQSNNDLKEHSFVP